MPDALPIYPGLGTALRLHWIVAPHVWNKTKLK